MEAFPYHYTLLVAGAGCVGLAAWHLWEWYRVRSFGLKDIPGPGPEFYSLGSFFSTFLVWSSTHSPFRQVTCVKSIKARSERSTFSGWSSLAGSCVSRVLSGFVIPALSVSSQEPDTCPCL